MGAADVKLWHCSGMMTDFDPKAEHPFHFQVGVNALAGFEIPWLPDVLFETDGAVSRADLYRENRRQFNNFMGMMLRGLHLPALWRSKHEEPWPADPTLGVFPTVFDLRIVGRPDSVSRSAGLRLFLLVKTFVPSDVLGHEKAKRLAVEAVRLARSHCLSLAPRTLTLRPLQFANGEQGLRQSESQSTATQSAGVEAAEIGLDPTVFKAFCDVRRENLLAHLGTKIDYESLMSNLANESRDSSESSDIAFSVPQPWPDSTHDLLSTCKAMNAVDENVVLSVRLLPTLRTPLEHRTIRNYLAQERERQEELNSSEGGARSRRTEQIAVFQRFLRHREFFYAAIQVAAETDSTAHDVASTYASEQMTGEREDVDISTEADDGRERPSRILSLMESERDVCRFNLTRLEFLPWGVVSSTSLKAGTAPGRQDKLPRLNIFDANNEQLRLPKHFVCRDLETKPELTRLRYLFTVKEANNIWRIPAPSRVGSAGVPVRMPSPFAASSISRGLTSLPDSAQSLESATSISASIRGSYSTLLEGKTMLVAGDGRAGKTAFVQHFLRILAKNQIPFCVLDTSRSRDYRALGNSVSDLTFCSLGRGDRLPINLLAPDREVFEVSAVRIARSFLAADVDTNVPVQIGNVLEEAARQLLETDSPDRPPNWVDLGHKIVEGDGESLLAQLIPVDCQGLAKRRITRLLEDLHRLSPPPDATSRSHFGNQSTIVEFGGISSGSVRSILASLLTLQLQATANRSSKFVYVVDDASAFRGEQEAGGSVFDETVCEMAEEHRADRAIIAVDRSPTPWLRPRFDCLDWIALHRLTDSTVFEQLASRLRLNPDQRRYAEMGLQEGEAVLHHVATGENSLSVVGV